MAGCKRQDFQVPSGWLRDAGGGKEIHYASEAERAISHVRSWVEWPLATSPGGRLETKLSSFGLLSKEKAAEQLKLRADLGC